MTIDVLSDNVLVEIFFYVNVRGQPFVLSPWHALVHVCRRWRYLVFASPRRLGLRLEYSGHRPISKVLQTWPVLPVTVMLGARPGESPKRWDNMVASLESEYHNRICEIITVITKSRWERFAAAVQKPFPELTHLEVSLYYNVAPVLPDSFLGGSAPRLQELSLRCIPLTSIPKLLLSANGLVKLSLWDIPDSGYISLDTMVTALIVMTKLESLRLQFGSPRADLCLRPHALSSPFSPNLGSKALMIIWRYSLPESMLPFSTTSTPRCSRITSLTSHNFAGLWATQKSSRHSTTERC